MHICIIYSFFYSFFYFPSSKAADFSTAFQAPPAWHFSFNFRGDPFSFDGTHFGVSTKLQQGLS